MSTYLNICLICSLLIATCSLQVKHRYSLLGELLNSSVEEHTLQLQRSQAYLQFISTAPVFGFENLVSSWIFLRFLQYFGNSNQREQQGYGLSVDFFEIIVDKDPKFVDSYLYLSHSVSIYAGKPLDTVRLMEKGLSSMTPESTPRGFFVWRNKAVDELLFLGDNQSAKISHEMAADWAEQSADPEAKLVARLSRQTASFLATDPNSKSAQISSWSQILARAIDDNLRQEAITRIQSLGGEILRAQNGQVTVRYNPNEK